MKKILITGAAGFIGSNLAAKLARRGDSVIGIDNFNSYYSPAKKRANAERVTAEHPNFTILDIDVREREAIRNLLATEQFDAIAHLAGMAGVRNSMEHPELYVDVNIVGTQNILDGARAMAKPAHVVFASTSTVYGNTDRIPFVEDDPADKPVQPYAATKRSCEILGHTYHHLFGISFTAVRFFSVYGPYNRPDMLPFLVLESLTVGKQIPLYDGGNMYRDWTFVDDITDGVVLALDKPLGFEVFNLGRGEPVLVREFIEKLETLVGKKANVLEMPRLSADVHTTFADISKAGRLLGYAPHRSVDEGIDQLWKWYRSMDK